MLNLNNKFVKYIVIILTGLALGYTCMLLLSKHYLTPEVLKTLITQRMSKALGREITIGGEINYGITMALLPKVKVNNLSISNLTGSKQPVMFSVETLEIQFDLLDLLFNQVNISQLTLIKPTLYLENIKQQKNWQFSNLDDLHRSSKTTSAIHIAKISVNDGSLSYVLDSNPPESLNIKSMSLNINKSNTGLSGTINAIYNNLELHIDGAIKNTSDEIDIKLNTFKYGSTDITGRLTIDSADKSIKGKLESKELNIGTLGAIHSSTPGDTSIPLDYIKDTDIDFDYKIGTLILNKLQANEVTLKIRTKKNVLTLNLDPALELPSGKISLDLTYDVNPSIPTANLKIHSDGLKLETLLTRTLGHSPISGSNLMIDTQLSSTGATTDTLINNLQGKVLLTASPGQYLHDSGSLTDLFTSVLTALITFDKNTSSTAFSCAVMNFKVNNGIATANRGIGLEAASVKVLGNGMVDLHNGNINFSIIPQNTSSNPIDLANFSVAQSVTVTGTLNNPKVNLNPLSMLSSNAAVATSIATKFISLPVAIASMATDQIKNSNEPNNFSPCKIALGN